MVNIVSCVSSAQCDWDLEERLRAGHLWNCVERHCWQGLKVHAQKLLPVMKVRLKSLQCHFGWGKQFAEDNVGIVCKIKCKYKQSVLFSL